MASLTRIRQGFVGAPFGSALAVAKDRPVNTNQGGTVMKFPRLSLSLLFMVGCAGVQVKARDARREIAVGETHWEACFPGRSFHGDETALLQMREDGLSLPEIAHKLGGSPQQVRCWEARLESRRATSEQMAIAATRK
jgi:hypothetical protein